MPCSARIFTSSAMECPRRLAFSRAISTEIATSPATCFLLEVAAGRDGNDRTSVALSFPRNCRLRDRNSELFVISTVTVSRKGMAFLARNTKRSSVDGLSPAILFRKIITLFPVFSPAFFPAFSHCPLFSRSRGSIACARRALRFGALHSLALGTLSPRQQQHLLFGHECLVLVIGANNALHQVMSHHIGFVEVNERQAFHALQYVNRFQQTAAPRVGQIDLRDVSGNHRFGVESEAGNEHLHLFGSGVLRFVENYK